MLTKGLIAPVFFAGAAIPYLLLTGQWRRWRALKPVSGLLVFLGHCRAVAHSVRAGQSRPGTSRGQPSHDRQRSRILLLLLHQRACAALLRPALSARLQQDAGAWYWLAHLVWIFPWSLFLPAAAAVAWKTRRSWMKHLRHDAGQTVDFYLDNAMREDVATYVLRVKFRARTIWLLSLFSAWTLLFFSISTNQEYYTFPVWPPLLMLIAGVMAEIEEAAGRGKRRAGALDGLADRRARSFCGDRRAFGRGAWLGACGLRAICRLCRHRHAAGASRRGRLHAVDVAPVRFDGPFVCGAAAAGRVMAAVVLLIGPVAGWLLRLKRKHVASTISLALTMTVFFDCRAHCVCALRAHAELQATGRHDHEGWHAERYLHHLRRAVVRVVA